MDTFERMLWDTSTECNVAWNEETDSARRDVLWIVSRHACSMWSSVGSMMYAITRKKDLSCLHSDNLLTHI